MPEGSAPAGTLEDAGLAGFSPAQFALVMATGIVSLAAEQRGVHRVATALFALNIGAYLTLWALTLLRMVRHARAMFLDLFDHARGPGFFTTVAATSVLGAQFVVLEADFATGMLLWALSIVLWVGFTYAVFTAFTIKREKPALDRGISGAWLLAVVAAQSVAVLGALLAPHVAPPARLVIHFTALSLWLWGGMLYIWMISLIFYRYTFFSLAPGDLTPPYWINMGAMAISTLAGSLLVLNAPDAPFLASLLPFIKGFTVFYWATGTWWIPMLVILAVWRYGVRRFPLRYSALYWGAVFPLGMYSASTSEMITAMHFEFLDSLPPLFFGLALAAWCAAFAGLVSDVARRVRRSPRSA